MGIKTRAVPELEFQRIVDTLPNLVGVASSMDDMVIELSATDTEHARRLRQLLHKLLDSADAISRAVLVSSGQRAA